MTSEFIPPIRDDLASEKPYGAPQLSVPVALNVNENTHPLPEGLPQELAKALGHTFGLLNRYPDREFLDLRHALASFLGSGLSRDQVWAANGSNEILLQIFLAFGGRGRKALSFSPSYSMYSNLALTTATDFVEVPRTVNFGLTSELVIRGIEQHNPTITLICNPNNPTGTLVGLDVVEAAAQATAGIVVVDEAYADFTSAPSAITLLERYPNLLVSRTMSKAFAFAGVRVGYLAAHTRIVDCLRIVRLPYHLSALTQAAALSALKFAPQMLATVEDIVRERERVSQALTGLGFAPYESAANFLLVAGFSDPAVSFQQLLDAGVLVRNVGIPGTLRITIGTRVENEALLKALTEIS